MATISKQEREKLQSRAFRMYKKDFELAEIAETIGVGERTIRNWEAELNWADKKKAHKLSPSQLRELILDSLFALKEGKEPPVKADDLSKYIKAYELLSSDDKNFMYAIETCEDFLDFLTERSLKAENAKDKKRYLEKAQSWADDMQEYIAHLQSQL